MGVFAVLALPFFLGRVYVADDLGEFHLPLRNFYAEQLANGEPFDWMRSCSAAFMLQAKANWAAIIPGTWCCTAGCRSAPRSTSNCWPAIRWLFAGMYLLLRRTLGGRRGLARGAGVHVLRLQPAALRPSQCDRHRGPPALAAVGHRHGA